MQDTSCLVLPIPGILFLSRRFSRVRSAPTCLSAANSARSSLTSNEVAWRAVSPAKPCLPASKNPFDHVQYRFSLIPSRRNSAAMLSSPRRPASTILISSSAEYCLRVLRRMPLTSLSAASLDEMFRTSCTSSLYNGSFEPEICQRRSKIRPRGGAKLGHFGFTRDAGDERRPVSRALHVAGG